jgi:TatA/E family protein of Tat protein translocase
VLLLILDSLGGTELLVILVVALVIFGPRKLPQLSRSLGRSLADFKRASHEFKETWEKEARMSDELREFDIGRAMLPPEENGSGAGVIPHGSAYGLNGDALAHEASLAGAASMAQAPAADAPADDVISASLVQPPSVRPIPADAALARGSLAQTPAAGSAETAEPKTTTAAQAVEQARKQDWL